MQSSQFLYNQCLHVRAIGFLNFSHHRLPDQSERILVRPVHDLPDRLFDQLTPDEMGTEPDIPLFLPPYHYCPFHPPEPTADGLFQLSDGGKKEDRYNNHAGQW